MPRGAQVIYPKDLGAILVAADLYPGRARARGRRRLGRAVDGGAARRLRGHRLRDPRGLRRARRRANVAAALGADVAYRRRGARRLRGDRRGRARPRPARPPRAVAGRRARRRGARARVGSSSPTCRRSTRPSALRERLARAAFALAETFEILRRTWHIEGRSVRPDHRMVAHTGFITDDATRRCATRSSGRRRSR